MTVVDFSKYKTAVETANLSKDKGYVAEVTGLVIKGYLPEASIGGICRIIPPSDQKGSVFAEVVGFKDRLAVLFPLEDLRGITHGARIELLKSRASVRVGQPLLGRIVDGLGHALDGKSLPMLETEMPLYGKPSNPLSRKPIREPLDLGVRAINGALTAGQGQRVGILAGSGVGKSVLLGMMARYTKADVNVICLIGERGREVREFIENDLGEEGLKRSVVVVVTSDQNPLLRMRGAFYASTVAEYFANQGKNVLLLMDSITRFAMAQREVGLSAGEPPTAKGYTPSVFSTLPRLLERAGSFENAGSITGLYTVLVEGDDMDDPIADSVRSIVDGHIVLSRALAQKGHFPAIDISQSSSRVMRSVVSSEQQKLAQRMREVLATYKEAEDLINIGAYKPGSNANIDRAIRLIDPINEFLKQRVDDGSTFTQTIRQMQQIFVNYG